MKILFHLGHPAHFHLFKNVITSLNNNGHKIFVLIKKKDVLEELLLSSSIEYKNILPNGRKNNKLFIFIGFLIQSLKMLFFCLKSFPNVLVGTSVSTPIISKLIFSKSINVNEDDAEVVPLYSKLSYPFSDNILAPKNCSVSKWSEKKTNISSYHELAYLHPNNFTASEDIASNYVDISNPYFIIRFAKLNAHHDTNIGGITNDIASRVINLLQPFGKIYITSERLLSDDLEKYRIQINPIDIHHVMAFTSIYIGDSQTMAAESAVLGVPFIRFNDFVGRISYLDELENKYKLGYGFKTNEIDKLYRKVNELIIMPNRKEIFQKRRQNMLSEKIDYSKFLIWYIENYPESVNILKENPDYQYRFR
jgi:hypothetical protein